jgi:hypothetical protein
MLATARIVLVVDVEYDPDAAGDRDMPLDIARTLAETLTEWDQEERSISRLEYVAGGLNAMPVEEIKGDGGPPYDSATATGMYDHD